MYAMMWNNAALSWMVRRLFRGGGGISAKEETGDGGEVRAEERWLLSRREGIKEREMRAIVIHGITKQNKMRVGERGGETEG